MVYHIFDSQVLLKENSALLCYLSKKMLESVYGN